MKQYLLCILFALAATGCHNAAAYSVFVKGTDVYVAGSENNGTRDVAIVWKNCMAQQEELLIACM